MVRDVFFKHMNNTITTETKKQYSEINSLLSKVPFRDQMFFVIRKVKSEQSKDAN